MKSFVVLLALVVAVAADVSHIVRSPDADAQILRQSADVLPDQYQYVYETSNGIAAQESGALVNAGREDASIAAQGEYSYTAPNGEKIVLGYKADANGFQPQGSHLPTTPAPQPIPDYIARALDYIARNPPKPEPAARRP